MAKKINFKKTRKAIAFAYGVTNEEAASMVPMFLNKAA